MPSYEQPSDNYLPPVAASSGSYAAADSGYQYGAAARGSVEQTTVSLFFYSFCIGGKLEAIFISRVIGYLINKNLGI